MKCPLRNTITHYPDEEVGIDTWDCLQVECAWWDKINTKCSIFLIAHALTLLEGDLSSIARNMPFKAQL